LPVAAKTTLAARLNGIKTLDRREYYSKPCRSRAMGLHWLTLWRRHGIADLLGKLAISEAAETMHKEYWGAINRMVGTLKR